MVVRGEGVGGVDGLVDVKVVDGVDEDGMLVDVDDFVGVEEIDDIEEMRIGVHVFKLRIKNN